MSIRFVLALATALVVPVLFTGCPGGGDDTDNGDTDAPADTDSSDTDAA